MNNTFTASAATEQQSYVSDDFTAIYVLYHDAIYRFCYWKCRDHDIGQNLMQDSFLRLWLCLERKEEVMNPRAFLYRVAFNLFVDHLRKKKEMSLEQMQESGHEPTTDPWAHTHNRLNVEYVLKKLTNMQKPYKQVLHQRFVLGLAPAEIAVLNGESANRVSVRITRGLKKLRTSVAYAL